jgi:DNA-binding beta-propeller fold protein YncE
MHSDSFAPNPLKTMIPQNTQLQRLWTALMLGVSLALIASEHAIAQGLPNPYRMVDGWAKLPDGRPMGAVGDLTLAPDGQHLWAIIRCSSSEPKQFGCECLDSDLDPILEFDLAGNVVRSFGGGKFIWPHGLGVDSEGNVWVTDGVATKKTPKGTRGHQVIKFSPTGEILMKLGTAGTPGNSTTLLESPSDVAVARNGDIFIADGHSFDDGNNRIVKFSKDGKFIKSWGKTGYAPGEFRMPHSIAIDLQGRVFVADRGNNRIQIFDQEGKFLAQWTQFGRPSGITFDQKGAIYVTDSESDEVENPGWEMGIRIGDARTGWLNAFVPYPWGDPRETKGTAAEYVAVDRDGNLYGGEPRPRKLQKYIRVRP